MLPVRNDSFIDLEKLSVALVIFDDGDPRIFSLAERLNSFIQSPDIAFSCLQLECIRGSEGESQKTRKGIAKRNEI